MTLLEIVAADMCALGFHEKTIKIISDALVGWPNVGKIPDPILNKLVGDLLLRAKEDPRLDSNINKNSLLDEGLE